MAKCKRVLIIHGVLLRPEMMASHFSLLHAVLFVLLNKIAKLTLAFGTCSYSVSSHYYSKSKITIYVYALGLVYVVQISAFSAALYVVQL